VPVLIVTADDYGYMPDYDRGILEAVAAGAVDAVSAFSGPARSPDPAPLLETGVEIGLHLDGFPMSLVGGERELELMRAHVAGQLQGFEQIFGTGPAYIDGHRHCHAGGPQTDAVAEFARDRGVPVRSVGEAHRGRLRELGAMTPDHLIGRVVESDPALPAELDEGGALAEGVTEWMVHPGHADHASGSSYDAGREEDLSLLLALGDRDAWAAREIERRTHAEALGAAA
jgi:chitin disaccharide deacetylase